MAPHTDSHSINTKNDPAPLACRRIAGRPGFTRGKPRAEDSLQNDARARLRLRTRSDPSPGNGHCPANRGIAHPGHNGARAAEPLQNAIAFAFRLAYPEGQKAFPFPPDIFRFGGHAHSSQGDPDPIDSKAEDQKDARSRVLAGNVGRGGIAQCKTTVPIAKADGIDSKTGTHSQGNEPRRNGPRAFGSGRPSATNTDPGQSNTVSSQNADAGKNNPCSSQNADPGQGHAAANQGHTDAGQGDAAAGDQRDHERGHDK